MVAHDGLLYHESDNEPRTLYVPDLPGMRHNILKSCHDSPFAGHMGRDRTLSLIRRWRTVKFGKWNRGFISKNFPRKIKFSEEQVVYVKNESKEKQNLVLQSKAVTHHPSPWEPPQRCLRLTC